MINIIIFFIFFILAAFFKAIMNTLQFHYNKSIFKNLNKYYWNPKYSWKNKYKNHDPNYGESFFCSTTCFVFLTDAWHLSQFLFLSSLYISIISLVNFSYKLEWWQWIIAFVFLKILNGSIFELFYKKIFFKI